MTLFKKSWFTAVTTNEAPIHEKIASYFTFRGKNKAVHESQMYSLQLSSKALCTVV